MTTASSEGVPLRWDLGRAVMRVAAALDPGRGWIRRRRQNRRIRVGEEARPAHRHRGGAGRRGSAEGGVRCETARSREREVRAANHCRSGTGDRGRWCLLIGVVGDRGELEECRPGAPTGRGAVLERESGVRGGLARVRCSHGDRIVAHDGQRWLGMAANVAAKLGKICNGVMRGWGRRQRAPGEKSGGGCRRRDVRRCRGQRHRLPEDVNPVGADRAR
mmetsp:Transcript_3692/g.11665  ORF Transcript_3692/g.11665 Transcript_3692/m.11665 type:complete len:219 (-) Transcript_3692:318-974(-)